MNRTLSHKPFRFALLAAAVHAVLTLSAAPAAAQAQHSKGEKTTADKVALGQYIVTVSGCNDCHTPWKMGANGPEPDMSRMLSGHPQDFALPPAPKTEEKKP